MEFKTQVESLMEEARTSAAATTTTASKPAKTKAA